MYKSLEEFFPTPQEPFKFDLFDRTEEASVLRQMIDIFNEGSVIGLNGKWGTGKTTFISMWSRYMEHLGYTVVNCNAWENDNMTDPLLAIIADFKRICDQAEDDSFKTKFTDFLSASNAVSIFGFIASTLVKFKTDVDLRDIKDDIKRKSNTRVILSECIDEYIKEKESINSFKKALSKFVSEISIGRPLIFVIDELDRCNPNYAVKTLERIKHLFCVKNVVFVLAIDKEQLCHSINGYFGSEKFDSTEYLRRFIDVEFELPTADGEKLIEATMNRYNYKELYCNNNADYRNQEGEIAELFERLYVECNLNIRQIEKYLLHVRLVLGKSRGLQISDCSIALFVFFKMFSVLSVEEYATGKMSEDDFIDKVEKYFNDSLIRDKLFVGCIVELMKARYGSESLNEKLFDEKDDRILFQSKRISNSLLVLFFKNHRLDSKFPIIMNLLSAIKMQGNIIL